MFLVLPTYLLLKGKSLIGFHFHNCCVYLCCRLPYIIKPRENNDEASNRVPNWSLLRDGPHTIFIGGDSSRTTYFLLKIFISSFGHGPVKMLPWTFLDSRLLTDWAITQSLHFILWLALLGNNYALCLKKKILLKRIFFK